MLTPPRPRFSNAEVASRQCPEILPADSTAGSRSCWTDSQSCPACDTKHQFTTRKIDTSDSLPQQLLSYLTTDRDGTEEEVPLSMIPGVASSTVALILRQSRTGEPSTTHGLGCTIVTLARDIQTAVKSLGLSKSPTISNTVSLAFSDTKDNHWIFYPGNFPSSCSNPPCDAHGGHTVARLRGTLKSVDKPIQVICQGTLSYDHILTRDGQISTLKTFFSEDCHEMPWPSDERKEPCIWALERKHAVAVTNAGGGLAFRVKNPDQDY